MSKSVWAGMVKKKNKAPPLVKKKRCSSPDTFLNLDQLLNFRFRF